MLPGYAYSLSTPSLQFDLVVTPDHVAGWLARLNDFLHAAFSAAVTSAVTKHQVESDGAIETINTLLFWTWQFQQASGLAIFEPGRIIGGKPREGNLRIAVPNLALSPRSTLMVLRWLVKLMNGVALGQDPGGYLGTLPNLLDKLRPSGQISTNVPRFLKAAHDLGMPYLAISGQIFQFGQGRRGRWLDSSFTDETPQIAASLARNKVNSASVMRQAGIPVPGHIPVHTVEAALSAAEQLGYPVVVKPVDMDGGLGVAAGLSSPEEVAEAYAAASKISGNILVEKHVDGRDYRLTVFRGGLLTAIERVPGGVVGDGVNTVQTLVEQVNADPLRGDGAHAPLKRLLLDAEARGLLRRAGLTADSVPRPGKFIRLRSIANIASGGTPVRVLDQVHPDNRALAIRAAEALRLDLAGVDLLIPDIAVSWLDSGAAVCEINAQPQLGGVTSAQLYPTILRSLVQGDGRIPIALLLGVEPGGTWAEGIAASLGARGIRTGWVDRHGVAVAGERIVAGPVGAYAGGRMLMMNRGVDAAVICIDDAAVLKTGLPFDRFDVLLLAGPHIAMPGDSGMRQPGQVIRAVLGAILPACRGKIVRVANSGLVVNGNMAGIQAEWLATPLEPGEVVESIADALLETIAGRADMPDGMDPA